MSEDEEEDHEEARVRGGHAGTGMFGWERQKKDDVRGSCPCDLGHGGMQLECCLLGSTFSWAVVVSDADNRQLLGLLTVCKSENRPERLLAKS